MPNIYLNQRADGGKEGRQAGSLQFIAENRLALRILSQICPNVLSSWSESFTCFAVEHNSLISVLVLSFFFSTGAASELYVSLPFVRV